MGLPHRQVSGFLLHGPGSTVICGHDRPSNLAEARVARVPDRRRSRVEADPEALGYPSPEHGGLAFGLSERGQYLISCVADLGSNLVLTIDCEHIGVQPGSGDLYARADVDLNTSCLTA